MGHPAIRIAILKLKDDNPSHVARSVEVRRGDLLGAVSARIV